MESKTASPISPQRVVLERLYGVNPNGSIDTQLGPIQMSLKPSRELIDDLRRLPRGKKVAIETLSPKDASWVDRMSIPKRARTDCVEASYWSPIVQCCNQGGHEVVYLDNIETLVQQARISVEIVNLKEEELSADNPLDRMHIARSLYAAKTVRAFLLICGKYDHMLKRIMESAPNVALMNDFQSQPLKSEASYNKIEGLKVMGYYEDQAPSVFVVQEASTKISQALQHQVSKEEFERVLSENLPENNFFPMIVEMDFGSIRDVAKRKHDAVMKGRITQKVPDFIGSWAPDIPASGLFEMFIEKRKGSAISGTIEDTYGPASFSGKLTANEVEFTKQYDPQTSIIPAVEKGRMLYAGSPELYGIIRGTFRSDGNMGFFEMHKFKEGENPYDPLRRR
jgi:hypothetical protein